MPVVSKPLLLDGALLSSLRLASNGRIPLGTAGDFHLPLAYIQQWPPIPTLIATCPQATTDQAASNATATATITSMNALSPSLLATATKNGKATKRSAYVVQKRNLTEKDFPIFNFRARSALSAASASPNKRRCSSA